MRKNRKPEVKLESLVMPIRDIAERTIEYNQKLISDTLGATSLHLTLGVDLFPDGMTAAIEDWHRTYAGDYVVTELKWGEYLRSRRPGTPADPALATIFDTSCIITAPLRDIYVQQFPKASF